MSENIELQEVVVDGMVVKMRRYNIRCHIVCRVLHRCERINLLAKRQNDNTARMLPRCPSHAGTSFYDTVDLAGTLPLAAFFVIIFHVTKCRLLGKRTNCSGTVSLAFSENNLGIAVSISLIITREIQVDIRLFVSLKSKECFKWNIKSFFSKLRSADRAGLIRHVTSGSSCIGFHILGIKIAVVAFLTIIMRTQRIYLGDPRHRRYERRPDRTS